MDLIEKMQQFNKRWNISTHDTFEQSFLKFKTRILNVIDGIDLHVTKSSIFKFCMYYGIEEVWHYDSFGYDPSSTNIIDRLEQELNPIEFYKLIELILNLEYSTLAKKEYYIAGVVAAIEWSDINVSIDVSSDDIVIYPKGEKMLDSELVNSPLSFLNKESAKHFTESLKNYQSNKSVKSAECLRRSLEEYLKFKLNNHKGLKENIVVLAKTLKGTKKDPQVRNIITTNLSFLDQYFNENSKHVDGDIDESENEFLIYQIGLLLRYVSKVL